MNVNFIKRAQIDEEKWNRCIRNARSNFPYGFTWYLNCVAPRWDALIADNYEAVFPLVWNQRIGIKYLYQPMFTQQLGIFSPSEVDETCTQQFIDSIPEKFKFIEINVNHLNYISDKKFLVQPRINLLLELDLPYVEITRGYHENAKRNLQKAKKNGLKISENVSRETVIEFFKANTGVKIPELGEYHYEQLSALMQECMKRNLCMLIGAFDDKDNLFAAGFFIVSEKKIINLLPSTGEDGKDIGAGFLLVDHIIKKYAGSGKTLDFEGSMITSIARFYKGFGAKEQTYWRIRRNNLPVLLKWIKG